MADVLDVLVGLILHVGVPSFEPMSLKTSIRAKRNVPVVFLTFLTIVDVPTDRPVVLYETLIGSLPVLKTGANLGPALTMSTKSTLVLITLSLMACGTVAAA